MAGPRLVDNPARDAEYYDRRFEDAYAAGDSPDTAWALLMISIGDAIVEQASLPSNALETLRILRREWNTGQPNASVLEEANSRIWGQLRAKHGNSTSIVDAADRALRALLCLAFPRNDHFRSDTIGWAAEMLSTEPWPRAMRFF